MKKGIYLISIFCYCYKTSNNYSVVIYPHVVINTSIDTIFMRDSTDFIYHFSGTLISYYWNDSLIDIDLSAIDKMAYIGSNYPPKGYFDLSLKDTFHIKVTGVSKEIRKLNPFKNIISIQEQIS